MAIITKYTSNKLIQYDKSKLKIIFVAKKNEYISKL